jgi:hypothetical protein
LKQSSMFVVKVWMGCVFVDPNHYGWHFEVQLYDYLNKVFLDKRPHRSVKVSRFTDYLFGYLAPLDSWSGIYRSTSHTSLCLYISHGLQGPYLCKISFGSYGSPNSQP